MKPLVTFPDAQMETLAVLRDRVPALADGVTFGTKPHDAMADSPIPLPYVAVRTDATLGRYPVVQTSTIRVSVWAPTEAEGVALAHKVRAVLLAYEGGPAIRSFGELTGPVPTADPDTGGPLCSFSVAARLRPITL